MAVVTVHGGAEGLSQEVLADGGADKGPSPYDLLLTALGA